MSGEEVGVQNCIVFKVVLEHDGIQYQTSTLYLPNFPECGERAFPAKLVFANGAKRSPLVGLLSAAFIEDGHFCSFEFTIRNPLAMSHAGGNWDLGAEGNVVVDELSVAFQPKSQGQVDSLSLDLLDCDRSVVSTRSIQLLQASSGGQNWDSRVHVDRSGNVPLSFRGYHVEADGQSFDGLRAVPVLNANFGDKSLSIGCRYFWQNFPSSMFADSEGLRLGLFPRRPTGGEELQGGEQKTFEFAVAYGSETAQSKLRKFVESDAADAASCASTDSVSWPYLTPRSDASDKRYEALVNQAIEGDDSFFTKREKVDEYGWRNFGDVWGDHEAVFHKGDSPLISHYNNQYDCTLGFGIQYLRTGDKRWLELMIPMADHAWDIDTYHTDQDKLVYNGGLFWHTYHYADAHTSTHRSYPKNLRISEGMQGGTDLSELGQTGDTLAKVYQIGGGPAAAHNYNTGWMVAYWLTGKERYKNAAINGADYVMRIDDGGKTPFRWLSRADTGYSTYSSEDYYGPGRAAANSTHALLTGHEITGDRKYLDRASLLMRRTVHPKQDLPRLDLLNAELRWFYTMYLQALGRYVDYKLNLDELDSDFRYGVACLRHYARWMTENERPTLSEPDKLQYPTETWSAQDMRKWHVLEHAARYECDEVIRARMCAKADFFFNYVVDYLTQSPTKSLCRPVILMLNFGWQREWLVEHRDAPAFTEEIEDDFGEPRTFVPQRAIAIKRFKMLVVAGGVVGIGSMAAIFAWLLFG